MSLVGVVEEGECARVKEEPVEEDLYTEVKVELMLDPEHVQPPDNPETDEIPGTGLVMSLMDVAEEGECARVRVEPAEEWSVKEELYAGHEVKDELVIGPERLQPPDISFAATERTHTGEKPFKCSHCGYKCSQKTDLLRHERTHSGDKPYKCDICDYKAALRGNLKKHLMSVHTSVKPFKCSYCSHTSSLKGNLLSHERTHTREKPYKCSHCSYTSRYKSSLMRHEITHTGEKPYYCDICDYKAVRGDHLKMHLMRVHAVVKPFKCSHCSHTSSQKSDLLRHEKTHTGEKPYKCDICDYKGVRGDLLKKHFISVHASVKPFKCGHCSFTSSHKGSLMKHEMTHTGEKPYYCDICDYKAIRGDHLKMHLMRVHAVVKPFKCSHCSHTSSHKGSLMKHEMTHTGQKPYCYGQPPVRLIKFSS